MKFLAKDMPSLWTTSVFLFLALGWRFFPGFLTPNPKPKYGGYVHSAFSEVEEVFRKNVESGREPGASFAVYRNGEVLVDLWGGEADPDSKRPWQQNTLSQAWSCTKGVVAIVIAMLVDRGLLDYNERVQTYWPEFGQNGKGNITLAMLLSHQGGIVSLGRQISLMDYRDKWDDVERLLAEQKPAWPPGTRYLYHAFTYGMYADAIVRRVDPLHRNVSQVFREDIAEPFGLDFYIGLPFDQYYRATRGRFVNVWEIFWHRFLMRPSQWTWIPLTFPGRLIHNSLTVFDFMNDMAMMNNPDLQSVGLSSALGFGTARSLARLYDYLANNGTVKGRRLLSDRLTQILSTPVTENIPVIAVPVFPLSMGVMVEKNLLGQPTIGHRGYGGQNAYADLTNKMGVTYITNFNTHYSDEDDPRAHDLLKSLYKCLQRYDEAGSKNI